jgi:hypothetical protein
MPYRVVLSSLVGRQIASWGLPDFLLVEINLRLRRDLAENPAASLVRLDTPFEGMCYPLSLIDPDNRLRQHGFLFHVVYSQDEETITVARGGYQRRDSL